MERNRLAERLPVERTPGSADAIARIRAQYGLRLTRPPKITTAGLPPQCAQWKQGTQYQRPDPDQVPAGPRSPPQQPDAKSGNSQYDRDLPQSVGDVGREQSANCVDHLSPVSSLSFLLLLDE